MSPSVFFSLHDEDRHTAEGIRVETAFFTFLMSNADPWKPCTNTKTWIGILVSCLKASRVVVLSLS